MQGRTVIALYVDIAPPNGPEQAECRESRNCFSRLCAKNSKALINTKKDKIEKSIIRSVAFLSINPSVSQR